MAKIRRRRFGAKGICLEELGDSEKALAEALAYEDGHVVVDAVVDSFALSLPSDIRSSHRRSASKRG
jgi:thiamine pyrophosphate-dependent acetolactate synthase large subunit-like protein